MCVAQMCLLCTIKLLSSAYTIILLIRKLSVIFIVIIMWCEKQTRHTLDNINCIDNF